MATGKIEAPNGPTGKSSYGTGDVAYKVGALVCVVCTTGTWYNDGANGTICKDSASGTPWVLPVGFRPVDEINFVETVNDYRMRVKTDGTIVCNTDISGGKTLRFSVCFISDARF